MSFEVSYAGVGLNLATREALAAIDIDAATETVDTLWTGWPDSSLANYSLGGQPRHILPKIGSLFDPASVSRPAIARFLCSAATIDAILDRMGSLASSSGSGAGSGSGASVFSEYFVLKLSNNGGNVERNMRLLPPKPLAGRGARAELWMLTFVDWRYDAPNLFSPRTGPYSTWIDYLNELDAVLAVYPDDADAKSRIEGIAEASLRPAAALWNKPPARWTAAVEAVCVCLGCRFAVNEGLIDLPRGTDIIAGNLETFNRFAGGTYNWATPTGTTDDADAWLLGVIPKEVRVAFRERGGTQWHSYDGVTGGQGGVWQFTATGVVCRCPDMSGSGSGSGTASGSGSGSGVEQCLSGDIEDASKIDQWVQQLADATSGWMRLGYVDAKAPGVFDWKSDGVHDVEWVYREGESYTRVFRQPFQPGVELLPITACEEVECCGGQRRRIRLVTGVCLTSNVPGSGSGSGVS